MSPEDVLNVADVTKTFGSFTALQGMSFHVKKGEILGLVGPNGSGKTTCMNVISGSYRADRGSIHFMGKNIHRTSASHKAVRAADGYAVKTNRHRFHREALRIRLYY